MNLMADNIIILKEAGSVASISPHDAAVLADWASKRKLESSDKDLAKGFSLIREGADLLLRRQALLTENKTEEKNNETMRIFKDGVFVSESKYPADIRPIAGKTEVPG